MTWASFSRTLVPQRRSSGSTTHRPRTNADVIQRRAVEAEAWQRQRQLRIPRWVHLLEWLVRMAVRRVVLPVVRRQLGCSIPFSPITGTVPVFSSSVLSPSPSFSNVSAAGSPEDGMFAPRTARGVARLCRQWDPRVLVLRLLQSGTNIPRVFERMTKVTTASAGCPKKWA